MRIAYLVNAPRQHLTGAANRALSLAESAAARGDRALIVGPAECGLELAARERTIAFAPTRFSAGIASWWQLHRTLAAFRPDVVHAMSAAPLALAYPGLLLGVRGASGRGRGRVARFVSVVVDPDSTQVFADGQARPATTARRNRMLARMSRSLDGVFAVSEPVRERLESLGVTGAVTLGGAAVDIDDLTRRAQEPIALPLGRPRIGSAVGQLEPLKGVDYLLRAFAQLTDEFPDAICLIAGSGSQQAQLESLAAELGIGSRVRFLGYLTEPAPFLAALDLHVHPSLSEGLGSVTAQAMALGVPVVATAVRGSSDVVTDGVTGLLVPPADSDALASAMTELLRDDDRARQLAENGRADIAAHHSAAAFADATWDRYEQALAARRAR